MLYLFFLLLDFEILCFGLYLLMPVEQFFFVSSLHHSTLRTRNYQDGEAEPMWK